MWKFAYKDLQRWIEPRKSRRNEQTKKDCEKPKTQKIVVQVYENDYKSLYSRNLETKFIWTKGYLVRFRQHDFAMRKSKFSRELHSGWLSMCRFREMVCACKIGGSQKCSCILGCPHFKLWNYLELQFIFPYFIFMLLKAVIKLL